VLDVQPAPHSTDSAAPNKRELNKQATRRAIAESALELLRTQGYDALTVDMVAAEANVSRRTFFNYFASINDALNVHVEQVLDRAVKTLDDVPADTPIMEAALGAMRVLLEEDLLDQVAFLSIQGRNTPSLHAVALASWDCCARSLTTHLQQRTPDCDTFILAVFSQAILGACNAAFQHWSESVETEPTRQDITRLGSLLEQAMHQVKDGFPTLTANSARKSA